MSEISQAIKAAIADKLPSTVANELAAFIDQANQSATELLRAKERIDSLKRDLGNVQSMLDSQTSISIKMDKLGEAESALRVRELALETKSCAHRAEVAEARHDATLRMAEMFLKVPTVRTQVLENTFASVAGNPGNSQYGIMPSPGSVVPVSNSTTTQQTNE